MATVIPQTARFVDGQPATGAMFNAGCDVVDFWMNPPVCSVFRLSSYLVATGAGWVPVPFDGEMMDYNDKMHSLGSNTSRIYLPVTGLYKVAGMATWTVGSVGQRGVHVRLNAKGDINGGSAQFTHWDDANVVAGGITSCPITPFKRRFSAGDHLEMFVQHTSTAGLNLLGNPYQTYFNVRLINP